jgi:hypothetical protein
MNVSQFIPIHIFTTYFTEINFNIIGSSHKHMVCADVNLLGTYINIIKRTQKLLKVNNEIGIEIAEANLSIIIFQNAEQTHNIRLANKTFGKIVRNKNNHDEIESRLYLKNACYCSVQNLCVCDIICHSEKRP